MGRAIQAALTRLLVLISENTTALFGLVGPVAESLLFPPRSVLLNWREILDLIDM